MCASQFDTCGFFASHGIAAQKLVLQVLLKIIFPVFCLAKVTSPVLTRHNSVVVIANQVSDRFEAPPTQFHYDQAGPDTFPPTI